MKETSVSDLDGKDIFFYYLGENKIVQIGEGILTILKEKYSSRTSLSQYIQEEDSFFSITHISDAVVSDSDIFVVH